MKKISIRKIKLTEFEKAAVKLSVFYVVIVMAISVTFSVSLYKISSREVDRGVGKTFGIINQYSPDYSPPGFESLDLLRSKQVDEISDHLKTNLFYYNLVILAMASVLGYFLARKTLAPLEKSMESQKRFTADASHELRTPLTAMRTEIEVALRNEELSIRESRQLLKSNIEEISKLEHLSDVLIKLARYQEIRANFQAIDISEVLVESFERLQSLAESKKIIFKNQLKSVKVLGDKGALVELFVIILDNAIKYSDKGKRIEISVDLARGGAKVMIRDHGIGIRALDLPHIFDRFYRADSSRTKDGVCNGYGLGLALAKEIVGVHGGDISVSSIVGKGSEFTVFLKA